MHQNSLVYEFNTEYSLLISVNSIDLKIISFMELNKKLNSCSILLNL